jgi:site-specific DNA recombinase
MKKAYLYIRSGTQAQAEESGGVYCQEEKLRQYCQLQQLEIAGIFKDIGSAGTFERPAFKQMLALMKKNGGKPSLLLFHTWDRFSRNASQAIEMGAHLKGFNIEVKAIEEPASIFVKQRVKQKTAI